MFHEQIDFSELMHDEDAMDEIENDYTIEHEGDSKGGFIYVTHTPRPKFTLTEFFLILAAVLLVLTIVAINTSCGPQFDREAMDDVKSTYCEDLLELAQDAKAKGITFTAEEKASIQFCREAQ